MLTIKWILNSKLLSHRYLEPRKGLHIFMYMKKIEKIIVTQEEIKMATRPNIYRNKKKYSRKGKARDAWRSEI
jgi:hypothetical protein